MNSISSFGKDYQWIFGKFTFIFFWVFSLYHILLIKNNILLPEGVFRWFNFDQLFTFNGKIFIGIISILGIILYLLDKKMLWATGILSATSILMISYQDSNGIFHRNTHFAAIFSAQFFAYLLYQLFPSSPIRKNRLFFSIQIIAAIYFMAAVSKIEASGFNWFLDPQNFLLQIYKNHFYLFADDNNIEHLKHTNQIISLFESYPILLKILLGISLALEFFCFLILISEKWKYPIAIGLICMHIGIAAVMGIHMSSIFKALISWVINPYYIVYLIKIKLKF